MFRMTYQFRTQSYDDNLHSLRDLSLNRFKHKEQLCIRLFFIDWHLIICTKRSYESKFIIKLFKEVLVCFRGTRDFRKYYENSNCLFMLFRLKRKEKYRIKNIQKSIGSNLSKKALDSEKAHWLRECGLHELPLIFLTVYTIVKINVKVCHDCVDQPCKDGSFFKHLN